MWHAGLSCQLVLKPRHGVLFDVEDENAMEKFDNRKLSQNSKCESGEFRNLLVYQLKRGSVVPSNIGIERDGENHVWIYPIGADVPITDIEEGLASYTFLETFCSCSSSSYCIQLSSRIPSRF